jgi:hypothetical protein
MEGTSLIRSFPQSFRGGNVAYICLCPAGTALAICSSCGILRGITLAGFMGQRCYAIRA